MVCLTTGVAAVRQSFGAAPCVGLALMLLAACTLPRDYAYPERQGRRVVYTDEERQSVFGPGGLKLAGEKDLRGEPGAGGGIGVNGFLWRASLDTLSFMPLASADPFGGVIITDWYSPAQASNERFKMTVYILDRRLRADGLRVAVFRQSRNGTSGWEDAAVNNGTGIDLENAILTRARQLRIAALPQ